MEAGGVSLEVDGGWTQAEERKGEKHHLALLDLSK